MKVSLIVYTPRFFTTNYLNRGKITMDFNRNKESDFDIIEDNKDSLNYENNSLNKSNIDENILDSLKNDLIKSIIGIFKFIFYFAPKTLIQFFRSILPTILKLLNVIILFLIWIQIIIFPVILKFYKINENIIKSFYKTFDFNLLLNIDIHILNDVLNSKLFIIWTLLALLGSLWGIKNVNTNIIDKIKKLFKKKNKS